MNRSILELRKQVEELKKQGNYTRSSAITCLLDSLVIEQKKDVSESDEKNSEESPQATREADNA